jgi:hypothetical protein
MTTKPTGLAAFTKKAAPEQTIEAQAGGGRKRAMGATVALTIRLSRADWARLRQLADAEGVSIQTLGVNGLSKVFAEHGLPPITP